VDYSSQLRYAAPGTVQFDEALGMELWELEKLAAGDNLEGYYLCTAMANSLDAENTLQALAWLAEHPPPGSGEHLHIAGHLSFRLGQLRGQDVVTLAREQPGVDLFNALIGWAAASPGEALHWSLDGSAEEAELERPMSGFMLDWAVSENADGTSRWLRREIDAWAAGDTGALDEGALNDAVEKLASNARTSGTYAFAAEAWADLMVARKRHAQEASPTLAFQTSSMLAAWAQEDPTAFLAFKEAHTDELSGEGAGLLEISALLAELKLDPRGVLATLPQAFATAEQGDTTQEMILTEMAGEELSKLRESDPALYAQTLGALDLDQNERDRMLVGRVLADRSLEGAFNDLQLLPAGSERQRISAQIAQAWLETEPEQARVKLAYHPALPIEIQQLLRQQAPLWQVQQALAQEAQ